MKNRIPKAAEDYKKEYYGRHDNAGAFYCSDYYEVLEAAENGGRSGHPLQCSKHSPRSGLYDRLQEGTAGQQEAQVVEMLQALSEGQRDRLQGFLEVILARKEGQATEADVVRCILGLQQEDIQPFTDILQAIGSRNK